MKKVFTILLMFFIVLISATSCEDDVIVVPTGSGECTGSYCKLDNSDVNIVIPDQENPKAK